MILILIEREAIKQRPTHVGQGSGLLSLMQGHSGAHSILLAKDGADFVNLAERTELPKVPEAAKSGRLAGNEGSSS